MEAVNKINFIMGKSMKFLKTNIASMYNYSTRFLVAMLFIALTGTPFALSIPALNLLSNEDFVILAGSTITGIPTVSMTGNVGLSPAAGSYVIGFDGGDVTGYLYVVDATGPVGSVIDASLLQTAKSDLTTSYNDAAGRTPVPTGDFLNPNGGNIGGLNLVPGLYKFTSAAAITGSDVTLTGSADDVWIFQIGTSLNVGSGIKVILAGGAQAANIFWQVGSSATIGTYATFKGTILADQSISFGTGSSMDGRALAFTGAVTMAAGFSSTKPVRLYPIFSVNPDSLDFGIVEINSSRMDSVTVTNTGTSNLVITSVTSSDTTYTVTPENGTISAGATKKYYVTFSPLDDSLRTGFVYFNHNASNAKDSISVSGEGGSGAFAVNPNNLNFGEVNSDTSKVDSVMIKNNGSTNLVISSISSSNTKYTYSPINGTIAAGDSMKVYVTFTPIVDGLQNGFIYFNHSSNLKDSISVTGTGVSSSFSVNLNNLNFGNVNSDTSKMDSVTVSNNGTVNLVISSISSSNTKYTYSPENGTIPAGESKKFYVTFTPVVDGLQNGFIYFNHSSNLKDSISVTGTGVSSSFSVNLNNLDFGEVNSDTSKMDSVTVTNNGTNNLFISSITSFNSTFTIDPENGTITPGSSQKFYVTFLPVIDGFQFGYVYFNHNAGNGKDSITVSGTGVSSSFSINLNNLDFGDVNSDTSKMDSVIVTNNGTTNLVINSISSSNSKYTYSPENGTVPAGGSKKFYVTFTPIVDGLHTGFIYFNHSNNLKDSITVTGTGVSASFSINLNNLDFGDVNSDTSKMDSVIVTNNGTTNLVINSISSSNSKYTYSPENGTVPAGGSKKFYVTFTPIVDGLQNGFIYFNHSNNLKDSITVSGTGVSASFTVNPNSLNFGNVRNETTKTEYVTVTNSGTTDLIISSVTSSNDTYTVSPEDGTIAPNETKSFYVTFAPLVDGLQTGYVYFNHNGNSLKDSISVSGTGVSPLFTVNPNSLNFGDVRNETTKTEYVTVTNTGTTDLIISSVTSSNNTYSVSPEDGTILPNDSMTFYVTFSPLVDGLQTGYVYFNHNGNSLKDSISVSGTGVSPLFTVNPNSLNFGNVRNETTKTEYVTVTNTGTTDLIISSVTSSNNTYSISPEEGTIAPNETMAFYVTFFPLVDGLQTGYVYFNHNAKISKDSIIVSGTGVSPLFTVNPNSLNFGNVRNETTKTEYVTVTNTGTTDLIIYSVTSSNNTYTVSPEDGTIAPNETKSFYVTFAPLVDGLQTGFVYFNHNAKISKDSINVSGTGVSPLFTVNPNSLNFGNVRNETTKTEYVTVTNTGTTDLIIYSVTSSNNTYTVSPENGTIAPNETKSFYVTFAPLVDGLQTGYVYFNHNAKISKDSISVSGTGVSPLFTVNPNSLNFGNVRNETTKTEYVTVTNTGTTDLVIYSVTSSNNTYTVSPEDGTIAPNETKSFYVTFAPLVDGLQTGFVYFNHNAKISKDSISISGTGVSPLFTVNPNSLNFGNVRNETTKTEYVTVTNTGTTDLIIYSVTSSNNTYTVSPEDGTIAPNETKSFYVTFAPLVDGLQTGYVYFNHNAKISKDSISVSGTGVSPLFTVNPNSLNFGKVRNETTKTEYVTVTNTGTTDLVIYSVTSSNNTYTVSPEDGTIAPNETKSFYVTFAPLVDGLQTGYVYFNHNAKISKDSISVSGTGVSPLFTVNPNSLNFGKVRNETTKTEYVTVTNTGTTDLVIYSVTSSNNTYTVSPEDGTIAPNETKSFYVTFAPLVDGLQTGYVYFNHNAKISKDSISVSGTGVSPLFTVNPNSLNFGKVRNETTKTEYVTVTNTGTTDLVIYSVTSSNNTYTVSPEDGTIAPNETKSFYVTFAPLVDGLQTGYVYFNHNAKISKDSISVSGTGVSPLFTVNPTYLNFGNVRDETSKTMTVTVKNTGTADLIIYSLVSSNQLFTFSPDNGVIAPGASKDYDITFSPLVDGYQYGYIYFNHNAKNPKDSISVNGTGVLPIFSLNPYFLNFGDVKINTTKTDSVTITNKGTSDLIISTVTSTNRLFIAYPLTMIIKPGESQTMFVTFAPYADGYQNAYIVFYHNGNSTKDSITVTGTGISPKFTVNPKSLHFGNVNINGFKSDSVQITNIGSADLILTGITSDDSHFGVHSQYMVLKPNESRWITITFTPLTLGLKDGFVFFSTNASTFQDSIYVSGTGVGDTGFPEFTVTPKVLNFGEVKIGNQKRDSVIVTNTGSGNLIIYNVNSTNLVYSATPNYVIISAGNSRTFYVTFTPQTPEYETGSIVFNHNAPTKSDSVFVTGTGVGEPSTPNFTVCPVSMNFGKVFIGKSKTKSCYISNTGNADLIISSIVPSNNQYSAIANETVVHPGTSIEYYVTFSPLVEGQIDATLVFNHNAGNGKDSITLTGIGVQSLPVITIEDARNLPLGTEFSIEGIVTRTKGNFTRIQDETGALTIIQKEGEFFDDVENFGIQMADMIKIQGSLTENLHLMVIEDSNLSSYFRINRMNILPNPIKLDLMEINSNGEKYESMLVKVESMTLPNLGDIVFYESKTYQTSDESDKSNAVVIRIGEKNDTYLVGMPFLSKSVTFEGVLCQSSISDPDAGYRLMPVLPTDLKEVATGVDDNFTDFHKINNYPNPFSTSTNIQYTILTSGNVSLKIFDYLGNEVITLVDEFKEMGTYTIEFNPSANDIQLSSMVYFYRLTTGNNTTSKPLLFVK